MTSTERALLLVRKLMADLEKTEQTLEKIEVTNKQYGYGTKRPNGNGPK